MAKVAVAVVDDSRGKVEGEEPAGRCHPVSGSGRLILVSFHTQSNTARARDEERRKSAAAEPFLASCHTQGDTTRAREGERSESAAAASIILVSFY